LRRIHPGLPLRLPERRALGGWLVKLLRFWVSGEVLINDYLGT